MFRKLAGFLLCPLLLLSANCFAQAWPQRPITIVVPFGAGGNTDMIARVSGAYLGRALGTSVVIDNRPGASGLIAAKAVLAAPADGYTLFMATATQLITTPHINANFTFDPVKDFAPVINIGANPFVLTVRQQFPARTIPELVALAKQQPGKITYGSGGVGALTHLSAYMFARRAEIELNHIPYKGGAPALADVIGGTIDMYSASPSEVIPHLNGGRIRFIGISSAKRIKELPDVPTIAETYPGFEVTTWNGLVAKAGTPPAILDRIASELAKMQDDPVIRKKLEEAGLEPVYATRAAFGAQIQKEYALWGQVLKDSGIKAE